MRYAYATYGDSPVAVLDGSNNTTDQHVRRRSHRQTQTSYLDTLPSRRSSGDAGGQVLYLPLTGAVVVPHGQLGGGWECVVLTDPTGAHQRGATCSFIDREIETALTVPAGDPLADLNADQFAAVWLTRVRARARGGGHLYAVARVLADVLRPPGSHTIIWDEPAQRRVATTARVLPPGLRRLIDTLTTDRLLTRLPRSGTIRPPSLRLTLPDRQWTAPPTPDTRM